MTDQTTAALHFGDQQIRGLTLVKPRFPLFFDALKAGGQIRLLPQVTNLIGPGLLGKHCSAGRIHCERLPPPSKTFRKVTI